MQYVGEGVFGYLSNMEEINLPEGLKEIGGRAFEGCEKLWIDKLPETLEFIGESAFEGCSSIPEVTLPENLTRIGDKAFKNCTGIYKVTINSRNLSVLTEEGAGWSSSVFLKCQGIDKLVVGSKVRILPNLGFESLKNLISKILKIRSCRLLEMAVLMAVNCYVSTNCPNRFVV